MASVVKSMVTRLADQSHPSGWTFVAEQARADAIAMGQKGPKEKVTKLYIKHPELDPHDIRINVTHSGVCHTDPHVMNGDWPMPGMYPIVPGHEAVGVVVKVGSEVTDWKVGERAGFGPHRHCCGECEYCKRGDDHLCLEIGHYEPKDIKKPKLLYNPAVGGWATQMQGPASYAFKIPDSIPSEKAAPLLCAGVTVYNPLSRHVKEGMTVGIHGIGGLGHLGVQFAKAMGCKVYAITGHAQEKRAITEQLGADVIVDTHNTQQLSDLENTLDYILSTNPRDADYNMLIELVKPGGRVCQVGIPHKNEPIKFDAFKFCSLQKAFIGAWVGSRKQTRDCLEFAAKHKVLPVIGQVLPLDQVDQALDKMFKSEAQFRQVLECETYARSQNMWKSEE
eukprot:SM000107S14036  [mRNA]  locus=s107:108433:110861:+ [translate_table: standard]